MPTTQDTLLVTGPLNSSQLGVPKDAPFSVVHVHTGQSDKGSNAFTAAMRSWLGGKNLRERLGAQGRGKLGVVWYSAGHGAVRSILQTTDASDVDAWLSIDGLYGGNEFAQVLAARAMVGETTLLATSSPSTPGTYADCLSRWKDTVAEAGMPACGSTEVATELGLPKPDFCWHRDRALVVGYTKIMHGQQVPECRKGAMLVWDRVRRGVDPYGSLPIDPPPGPGDDPVGPVGPPPGQVISKPLPWYVKALISGGAMAGSYMLAEYLTRKR